MRKYLLLVLVLLLGGTACQHEQEVPLKKETPHVAVIKQTGKANVVILNKDYKVVGEKKIGEFLIDGQVDGQTLYAIDPGIEPALKNLYAINVHDLSYQTLPLPYIPQKIFIHDRVAYIASSSVQPSGFPLMLVDLESFSLIDTFTVPGAARPFLPEANGVTLYVNAGGPHNYGPYAKKVRVGKGTAGKYEILETKDMSQELPPTDVISDPEKNIAVYAGFAKGPKPRWVKQPEAYTSKMKVLDKKNDSVLQEIDLDESFPQQIVRKGDLAFINHYTDLDMTGEMISVYDLQTMKLITKIRSETPSSIALDGSHLLVANVVPGTVSVIDTQELKQIQQVDVGEWPTKVLVIPE
ncbi:YncE family protein [Brevibacillus sp. SAFN-007a]|uniref:YncE family protein n=1 Tax=Brevibacillus sp. SAFN-007a TaxID=3436862 RepID=UPI003F7D06B0